jgi:hypothetical protein
MLPSNAVIGNQLFPRCGSIIVRSPYKPTGQFGLLIGQLDTQRRAAQGNFTARLIEVSAHQNSTSFPLRLYPSLTASDRTVSHRLLARPMAQARAGLSLHCWAQKPRSRQPTAWCGRPPPVTRWGARRNPRPYRDHWFYFNAEHTGTYPAVTPRLQKNVTVV